MQNCTLQETNMQWQVVHGIVGHALGCQDVVGSRRALEACMQSPAPQSVALQCRMCLAHQHGVRPFQGHA